MLRAEAREVIIQRPVAEVFEHYADGRLYGRWLPGAAEMRLLTPEPVGVGSQFTGQFPGFGTVRWTIEEFDRPRRLVNLGQAPIGDMRHTIGFEAVPGGTRVTQRGDGELKGIFRALAPLATPLVRRGMTKNWHQTALQLKRYLEGQDQEAGGVAETGQGATI